MSSYRQVMYTSFRPNIALLAKVKVRAKVMLNNWWSGTSWTYLDLVSVAFSAKTRALIDSVSRSSISMNFLEQRTQKKCKKESFWTLSFPPNGALDLPASRQQYPNVTHAIRSANNYQNPRCDKGECDGIGNFERLRCVTCCWFEVGQCHWGPVFYVVIASAIIQL